MKVSKLNSDGSQEVLVQTTRDEYHSITDSQSRERYIARYGDQDLQFSVEKQVFEVINNPSFQLQRKRYIEAKVNDCLRWGCE